MKSKILYIVFLGSTWIFSNLGYSQTINLRSAAYFTLFTSSGAFDNYDSTYVKGNIGTNVGVISGFPPGIKTGTAHAANSTTAQAALDLDTTFTEMSALSCGSTINVSMGGGQTLIPGIYCTTAASSLSGDLTLDAQGDPNAIFIIKTGGALTTSTFSRVLLVNSAYICNVYWQINGAFTLGDSSLFQGNLLASGAISLLSGSALFGRGLSKGGAIDLHGNLVELDDTCTFHNVLPIALIYFKAKCEDLVTVFTWATATELNNDYFTIEKNIQDDLGWIEVKEIQGAGNSSELLYYTYSVTLNNEMSQYYRLKQTDFNGDFSYSETLSILPCKSFSNHLLIFPNPSDGCFKISTGLEGDHMAQIVIFNSLGNRVVSMPYRNELIDISNQPNGIYFIQLTQSGESYFEKVVLNQ